MVQKPHGPLRAVHQVSNPTYKPWKGHLEGVPQPYLGNLLLMAEILPLFTGFYTSQVVQDFFHQQY